MNFGETMRVKGESFYVNFTFRGIVYRATGRFGYVASPSVLVSEAVGPAGEITWSDSEGDFYVYPAGGEFNLAARTCPVRGVFSVPVPSA